MQVRAVEQEIGVLRKDLPASIEVCHELAQAALTKEVCGHGAIPQQGAGVCARDRHDVLEQSAADLPVRRPTAPAAAAAVPDQWKTAEVSRREHADVGMKNGATEQHVVRSHRLPAIEI